MVEAMTQNLPSNAHVLFISEDEGFSAYYLPTSYQNVMVDVDGQVAIPLTEPDPPEIRCERVPAGPQRETVRGAR